jgi:uncharacterized protein
MKTSGSMLDQMEITLSEDQMCAYMKRKQTDDDIEQEEVTSEDVYQFLKKKGIVYGVIDKSLQKVPNLSTTDSPLLIAKGVEPIHGCDGKIVYEVSLQSTFSQEEKDHLHFRQIKKIPTVTAGEKLVTVQPPTIGTPGKNVLGRTIPQKRGRKVYFRPGKNTSFKQEVGVIYATSDGQVSIFENSIEVLPTIEINDDLDMKVGNIDFIGSVVIHGDVPTGYSIKANGDIKIYGLVEGAHIEARGSIFIQEGISAMKKGKVIAGLDLHAKYINQGSVEAGRSLFVEESIIHSDSIARENVFCKDGNIIGGSVSAGKEIMVKDVGNRLSIPTMIYLGENKNVIAKRKELEEKLYQLTDSIKKLKLLGEKLEQLGEQSGNLSPKDKITKMKQKYSLQTSLSTYNEIHDEYQRFLEKSSDFDLTKLSVRGILYPNIEVIFGKYHKKMLKEHKNVQINFQNQDISITVLKDNS